MNICSAENTFLIIQIYEIRQKKSPLVIVDSSVILKMSNITRESTISREIKASTDNQSTEHIHYNKTRYTITRDDCSLNRILCSFHISPLFIALKEFQKCFLKQTLKSKAVKCYKKIKLTKIVLTGSFALSLSVKHI